MLCRPLHDVPPFACCAARRFLLTYQDDQWISKLAQLRASRQWFDLFASVERNGQRYMKTQDVLRALTLIPDADKLEQVQIQPHQTGIGAGTWLTPRVRLILLSVHQTLSPDALKRVDAVFALADTDYDGVVSYWEFLFFLKLLASMRAALILHALSRQRAHVRFCALAWRDL